MNKTYLYIGIAVVVLIIAYLLIQNSKDKAALAAATAAHNTTTVVGGPAWLQALNSPAIASLLGGFGAGVGTSVTKK